MLDTGSHERTDLRGVKNRTALEDDIARVHVSAAWPDVVQSANRASNLDLVVIVDNILDRHDGVGTLGYDAARCDRHCFARSQQAIGRTPRSDLGHHRQPPGRVRSADREPVHCGARERRQIHGRKRVCSEHTSCGVLGGDLLRRQPMDVREDHLLRFRE